MLTPINKMTKAPPIVLRSKVSEAELSACLHGTLGSKELTHRWIAPDSRRKLILKRKRRAWWRASWIIDTLPSQLWAGVAHWNLLPSPSAPIVESKLWNHRNVFTSPLNKINLWKHFQQAESIQQILTATEELPFWDDHLKRWSFGEGPCKECREK